MQQINLFAYWSSRDAGGGIQCRCISVKFEISNNHKVTSGLSVPGVGYLWDFCTGKDPLLVSPPAGTIVFDENHGNIIVPTLESLNEAYNK